MIEAEYLTTWAVDFPDECNTVTVFNILESNLLIEWSWEDLPRDLKRLQYLLSKKPASFDYLYMTRMLRSRASQLIIEGPFRSQAETVQEGIARLQLQWPSIYRHLFLQELETILLDMCKEPSRHKSADRLLQTSIRRMESTYLRIMETLCFLDDEDENCHGYPMGCWVKGELVNDGARVFLVPDVVRVPVLTKQVRGIRIIKPCKRELAEDLHTGVPERDFREPVCMARETDAELEKLCCSAKPRGMKCIQYAGRWIPYYRTIINDEKNTLFVICGDRTLRIEQAEEYRPGSYPEEIFAEWPGWGSNNTYMVRFVNGKTGGFTLTCRAHRESETRHAPTTPKNLSGEQKKGIHKSASQGSQSSPYTGVQQLINPVLVGDATTNLDVIIERDYMRIHIGGVQIDFYKKKKRRDLVRFLHEWKQVTGLDTFSYREKAEDFAKQTGRTIECDRFEEDLFRGQSREFRLLFEIVDKQKDLYRIKI